MKSFSIYSIFAILLLSFFLFQCKKAGTPKVEPVVTPLAPVVTLTEASNITANAASAGGIVTADGGAAVTVKGVCWSSTNTTPTTSDSKTSDGTGTGTFSSTITGLTPGTTYNLRAYATNSVGTGYSSASTFKTLALSPTLTTTAPTVVTSISFSSGGNITADGGSPVTARGVCWGTATGPTIASNKTSDGTGTGAFVSAITGLTAGSTYYVRSYATNSAGTAYGNEISFKTLSTGTTVAGGNGSGSAANQLFYPEGVFVDASGNIYVADANNFRIQKWAPGATSGTTVAGGNGGGSAANQFFWPRGVFLDASGNIYVADHNHRIQKWAPGATSGTTVAGGNGQGSAANQLLYPRGVFVDATGNIYVADEQNHRIQKWAPGATSGTTVAGGNGQGSAANQLGYPRRLFLDATGNIYVADQGNDRIQKWAPGATTGTTVAGGNGQGSAAYQFNSPYGVFVDASGNIYVADQFNHRIQKWAKP
jgi:hypothetical protein